MPLVTDISHLVGPGEPADLGLGKEQLQAGKAFEYPVQRHLHRIQESQAAEAGDLGREIGQWSKPAGLVVDLSRVAEPGSVTVPNLFRVETFPTIHQLVSDVTARLPQGAGAVDLLRAAFPCGSITGAPKVRAMEIIAELENRRRGVYAGAVGYVDFAGNLDFCITIRTVVIEGGRAYVQAGAGIVADSNPTAEFEETRDKARAVIRALELAQAGL